MKFYSVCALGCVLLAGNASGLAITVGTQGAGAAGQNCSPFGCGGGFGAYTTYQQIYSSTAFSGPITIQQITFFNTTMPIPGESLAITPGIYTLSLSSTTVALNALSFAAPANNLGADNQLFFSGSVNGSFTGGSFTFIGAPFTYDPGTGRNLLLTIGLNYSAPDTGTRPDVDPTGTLTRFVDFGIPNFDSNSGLITRFADVPLPPSLSLSLSGMVVLGLYYGLARLPRRKRSPGTF